MDKEKRTKIIEEFKQGANDTGSIPVQVAILTERIKELTDHLKTFKKDFSAKRGLLKLVSRRKRFLKYIASKDVNLYNELRGRLGIRK